MHQFSRRLFGANSREVREFLAEAAVELDRARGALARANAERDAIQNRLREVATEVDRLRGQVAVAHEKIAAHQAQEALAAQMADEREVLIAEREVLRSTLRQITSEVDRLRGQVAAAEEKIAASQAQENVATQLMAERDALAALRDSLQNRLKEATTELHRLREQAAAAREKIAANQTRKALAAQMVAERDALRKKLKDVTTEVQALRDQVATAHMKISAYQAEDREIAETLFSAQKAADDLVHAARQRADDAVSAGAAQAEQAIQAARRAAAETLRAAQTRAEEAVRAAEQVAETRLAQVHAEAEWLAEEARRTAADVEQSAKQIMTGFVAQLQTFIADGEFLVALRALGENLAGSMETLARLQSEAHDEILPALHRLVETIKERRIAGQVASPAPPAAVGDEPLPPSPSEVAADHQTDPVGKDPIVPTLYRLVDALSGSLARQTSPTASPGPAGPATPPAPPPSQGGEGQRPGSPGQDRVIRLGLRGEIVVSPVRTRYRATKIAEGVSRLKGIRVARLRALQEDAASIEVITEAGPLAGIDFTMIDGVLMDVVDASDARIVLRVARTLSHSIPG